MDKKILKKENKLLSPFSTDFKEKKRIFDEEKIRKSLEKIMPEKDYHLIDYVINDKRYYFPNDLKIERGVFRENNGNLLEIVNGNEKGFDIPSNIVYIGTKTGLSMVSHNHLNGIPIPSKLDIASLPSLQSQYNPIYSPNKNGLLVNTNLVKNQENWKEISNKYNIFINNTNKKIEIIFPEEAIRIRNQYGKDMLQEKLNDFYRPYYIENQDKIVENINCMFKDNGFQLKLYIL